MRVRDNLSLYNHDADSKGKSLQYADNIIYDIKDGVSASGIGHSSCPGLEEDVNTIITGDTHGEHDIHPLTPE